MRAYPSSKMAVRRAEWIWRQRPVPPPGMAGVFAQVRPFAQERNRFVYFRRSFELSSAPTSAPLYISADGRYQLFVNGTFVGRGPARCDPAFQYYDSYEIAPCLVKGNNVIAILAHSYGQDMAWYQLPRHEAANILGCGGIFVQVDIHDGLGNGQTLHIDSDESWLYLESVAWKQDTSAGAVGFVEEYDARLAPMGWLHPTFNDQAWDHAQILSGSLWERTPPVRPFPHMVPRDIPHLAETLRRPARLHTVGEVTEAADEPTLPQQIGAEALGRLRDCRAIGIEQLVELQLVSDNTVATIQTTPGKAVALVFDFGATVTGRPTFDITAADGTIVDIGCSERLQDDHIEPRLHSFLTSENVDRVILRAGRQQWERFEWTGLRYLQLTIRNASEPLTIHHVALNFTTYPVEERGTFVSSDDLLNRIWQAGAMTLQLCMHDAFEDCPQREQRQFVGDAYIEAFTNYVTFGDSYLTAKFLRQVLQSQRADGLTQVATPSDFGAAGTITITDFCLYWLMAIREYVRYTGDVAILDELYPGIERALAWFARHVDTDGLLNNLPHWLFVDWATMDKRGQSTIINAQYVHTLMMSAELAELYGLPTRAQKWRALAEQVKAGINHLLWDEERGVYVDARMDGVQMRRVSQHANGICLAYDIAPSERQPRIIAYITDPQRIKLTPTGMGNVESQEGQAAFDEESDVVLTQPFFSHHLHRGLLRAGHSEWVLQNIRQRWGAMLAAGSSTIWELWSPMASQCHAWSTTPTFDLSTYVLGIMPLANGFDRVLIAPHPGDLAWAKGCLPTPHGNVEVAWEWRETIFHLAITLPKATAFQVHFPFSAKHVEVEGHTSWSAGQGGRKSAHLSLLTDGSGPVTLVADEGGSYSILAQR